ncbi:MAG: hypothetical protein HPY82_14050 [Gammaproteobacteria bacterium]|nr:hypothetical protein [Gammaproteobacteria bacterium]
MKAIKKAVASVGLMLWTLLLPVCLASLVLPVAVVQASDFGNGTGAGPNPEPETPPCSDDCCDGAGAGGSGQGGGGAGPSGAAGQPISLLNGRETVTETDLEVPGLYGIRITRKYRSDSTYDSPLGYGWVLNYDQRLYEYPDGSVLIRYDCGVRDRYVKSGGSYTSNYSGRQGELKATGGGGFSFELRNGTREYYDSEGKLILLQNREGHVLELSYDPRGKLPLVGTSPNSIDANQPMVVAYHHRLTQVAERSASGILTGRYVDFEYNETTGRLSKAIASDGREVVYEHQVAGGNLTTGNLAKVTGLENYIQEYQYDDPNDPAKHRLTWFRKGEGTHPYVNVYDTAGRVTQQTHGADVYGFAYNQNGIDGTVTRTIVDENGANPVTTQTHYWFDSSGRVEKMRDALGNETQFLRNSRNQFYEKRYYENRGTVALPNLILVRTESFDYDSRGNQTTQKVILENGATHVTKRTFKNGWVVSELAQVSGQESQSELTKYVFNYDSEGRPLNIKEMQRYVDATRYLVTQYSYDSDNRLTRTTYPDGAVQVYSYDPGSLSVNRIHWEIAGQISPYQQQAFTYNDRGLLETTTLDGKTTRYTYDDRGRVSQIENALNEFTDFHYVNLNLEWVESGRTAAAAGTATRSTFDGYNRVTEIARRDGSGQFITANTLAYDSAGRLLRVTDAESQTVEYGYDNLGRRIWTRDGANNLTQTRYDMFGKQVEQEDAAQRVTKYVYDLADRLSEVQQLGITPNVITRYGYDGADNLKTVTDPEGNTTTYLYDRLGRQTDLIQPLGQTERYTYDDRDRLKTRTTARGYYTVYDYFPWGPVDTVRYYTNSSATTPFRTVSYTYHAHGQVATVSDSAIKTGVLYEYTYDNLLRPKTQTAHYLPGGTRVLSYGYTAQSSLKQLDLIQGSNTRSLTMGYDAFGRPQNLSWGGSRTLAVGYHDNDTINTLTWPNATQTRSYYSHGPLQTILSKGAAGSSLTLAYTYDALLNIQDITQNGQLNDYDYDGLDRLTRATHPSGLGLPTLETFGYDRVGNRENPDNAATYHYDANNRILQGLIGAYQHDADGNRQTQGDGATFTHNEDNRLVAYTKGSTSATYSYDPYGRRIKKTVNGTTTWFLWNGSELLAEYNSAGTLQRRFGNLYGAPVAYIAEANNLFFAVHTDHLGTPRWLTNSSGGKRWVAEYEAFGKGVVNEDPDNDGTLVRYPIRFPGQYYDTESGLHYNYFRDYDPSLGRYVQSDPIGLAGGVNVYAYVENNPLIFQDEHGLAGGRGERGATGGSSGRGTGNQYKHCRPHPTDPTKIICRHHQTGKDIIKPKPADFPQDRSKRSEPEDGQPSQSECSECATTAVVVVGAAGVTYIVYRCIRMVPSLLPPLWPTIPANLAIP